MKDTDNQPFTVHIQGQVHNTYILIASAVKVEDQPFNATKITAASGNIPTLLASTTLSNYVTFSSTPILYDCLQKFSLSCSFLSLVQMAFNKSKNDCKLDCLSDIFASF